MTILHSAPGEEPITVEGLFDAPADRVFRAWTEPEEIMKWFGASPDTVTRAEIDLRVGGQWRFFLKSPEEAAAHFEGEYLAVEPGRKLVFSWAHVVVTPEGERERTPSSRVTIAFEPVGEQTRVHLRHEAIQSEGARRNVGHGWKGSFERLARRLA